MKKKRLLTDRSGQGLEEQIVNKMGQDLARDVDREILWGMLESMGWTRVMLPSTLTSPQRVDIATWLNVNCKHPHECHGRDFIFEDDRDAMWFKLKWLS